MKAADAGITRRVDTRPRVRAEVYLYWWLRDERQTYEEGSPRSLTQDSIWSSRMPAFPLETPGPQTETGHSVRPVSSLGSLS